MFWKKFNQRLLLIKQGEKSHYQLWDENTLQNSFRGKFGCYIAIGFGNTIDDLIEGINERGIDLSSYKFISTLPTPHASLNDVGGTFPVIVEEIIDFQRKYIRRNQEKLTYQKSVGVKN